MVKHLGHLLAVVKVVFVLSVVGILTVLVLNHETRVKQATSLIEDFVAFAATNPEASLSNNIFYFKQSGNSPITWIVTSSEICRNTRCVDINKSATEVALRDIDRIWHQLDPNHGTSQTYDSVMYHRSHSRAYNPFLPTP